jgi:transposase InsO family protein
MSLVPQMNKTSNESFVIEKFNGENYHVWAARMQMELEGNGLWSLVSGQEGRPNVEAGDAGSANKQLERQLEFDQRALRAKQLIGRAVSDVILMSRGLQAKSAAESWKELQQHYAGASIAAQMFVEQRFAQARMREGDDVATFIHEVNLLVAQLAACGGAVDEKKVVIKLLTGLPDSWRPYVAAIEGQDPKLLTKAYVEERLQHEQLLMKKRAELQSSTNASEGDMVSAAMLAGGGQHRFGRGRGGAGRGASGGGSERGSFPFNCYNCGRRGHRARDCTLPPRRHDDRAHDGTSTAGSSSSPGRYERDSTYSSKQPPFHPQARTAVTTLTMSATDQQPQLRSQQQLVVDHASAAGTSGSSSTSASSTSAGNETLQSYLFTAGLQLTSTAANDWILDSGASRHMCNDIDMFVEYIPFPKEHAMHDVAIGDGRKLKVAGTGRVRLVAHGCSLDGRPQANIISLMNVLHVPALSANLFSVGCVVQAGHVVQFTPQQCNIVDPVGGIVVIQAIRAADGLYKVKADHHPMWSKTTELAQVTALLAEVPRPVNDAGALWHQRLGHISESVIQHMQQENLVTGLEQYVPSASTGAASEKQLHPFCVACVEGKQHAEGISKNTVATRGTSVLQLVHSDVVGPMKTVSHAGYRYFITFIDDMTRCVWVQPMKQKSEALRWFKSWQAFVEKLTGAKVKALRSDHGGEYMSAAFQQHLQQQGIVHQRSAPYTPQQNGVAERCNRTLVEMARAMLHHAQLDYAFWADAVMAAAYVCNRVMHKSVRGNTPLEMFTANATKADVSRLRVFGCDAYVLVPEQFRHKFQSKTHRCVFVGYTMQPGTYRLWDPVTRATITSRNVVFNETSFLGDRVHAGQLQSSVGVGAAGAAASESSQRDTMGSHNSAAAPRPYTPSSEARLQVPLEIHGRRPVLEPVGEVSISVAENIPASPATLPSSGVCATSIDTAAANHDGTAMQPYAHLNGEQQEREEVITSSTASPSHAQRTPYAAARPHRARQAPGEWWKAVPQQQARLATCACENDTQPLTTTALLANVVDEEPQSLEDALQGEDSASWHRAVEEEMESIRSNNVYEVADLPPDRKVVRSKFVFRIKRKADGTVERYKARLVARGFSQQEGVDYGETFAPVAKFSTIRTVLAVAAARKLAVHQMDVKTAFLHGDLEQEVFMEPPLGLKHPDIVPGKVWRLHKALYGLKQAPRQWNIKLHEFLTSLGFTRMESDHSLYVRGENAESVDYGIIVVYVDDLLIAGSESVVMQVKAKLESRFTMTDLGSVQWLLGIEIQREGNRFLLSQKKYIASMLERFGMQDCKPLRTPLDAGERLTTDMSPSTADDMEHMRRIPYRSAVGSLMYLMVATRPDIAAAVGVVSRFLENPGVPHWHAVKHIFRYLRGTAGYVLQLGGGGLTGDGIHLCGYCDADWAGDGDTRRSTTGYAFSIGTGAVSWNSKRQATVALSSTEAEYMAASAAAREAIWLRTLLEELKYPQQRATIVHCDNQGAIALTHNPVHHQRTKHIDVRHHFIREMYESGQVDVKYIPTHDQVADIMTKALLADKHYKCSHGLGLQMIVTTIVTHEDHG